MSMRRSSHKITICEVLREINDLHQGSTETDIKTRKLLAKAEKMAKKMSAKLLEYNKAIFADWWEENRDYEEDLKRRLNKHYVTED